MRSSAARNCMESLCARSLARLQLEFAVSAACCSSETIAWPERSTASPSARTSLGFGANGMVPFEVCPNGMIVLTPSPARSFIVLVPRSSTGDLSTACRSPPLSWHQPKKSAVLWDRRNGKQRLASAPCRVRNWWEQAPIPFSRRRTTMSDLVVIAFPTEAKAEEVRQKLLAMQKEYLIELGDAVIAVKDSKGQIKLNQLINTTAVGAVSGTFWGALIGLIFLMPLVGAAVGAASGAIGGALTELVSMTNG